MPENDLKEARAKALALRTLSETDGGKIVIDALRSDVARIVEQLTAEYRTGSHFELVRLCSDLSATLSLYRALTRSEKQIAEIDTFISEALKE